MSNIQQLLDKQGDQIFIIYLKIENRKTEISKELRESIEENLKKLSDIHKAISLEEQSQKQIGANNE